MKFNPRLAWKKIRELNGGPSGYQNHPNVINVKFTDGSLALNDEGRL